MNSYKIIIYKNDIQMDAINLIDGDSFVFDTPGIQLSGRNAILRWKLRKANRAIKTLHELLDNAHKNIDLSYLSTDDLIAEVHHRLSVEG